MNNICPECGESRPGDERVKNGLKCFICAYGNLNVMSDDAEDIDREYSSDSDQARKDADLRLKAVEQTEKPESEEK